MRYSTILLAMMCVACGSYSANVPSIKPYKMDIQQGNVVTPKMMMQLRPGMTKAQVRFIMGTPLLVDSFHADQWNYFYQMRKDGKIIEQRRVILEFDGDSLARVRGDVIPAGTDVSQSPAASAGKIEPKSVAKSPKEKEKGLLDKLKFWGDDGEAPKSQSKPAGDAPKPADAPMPAKTGEVKPAATPKPEQQPAPAPLAEDDVPTPVEQPLPPLMEEHVPPPTSAGPAAAPPEASQPRPQEEKKGVLDKLKFWERKEQPKPETASPAPRPAEVKPTEARPVEAAKPAPAKAEPPKAQPDAEKPAAQALKKSQPEAKPKVPPQPVELPPEDAPDFFEKMLEKIGF
jgi:outer membrane protein assembly factor BamE